MTFPVGSTVKYVLIKNMGTAPLEVLFDSETTPITLEAFADSVGAVVLRESLAIPTNATSVTFTSVGAAGHYQMVVSYEPAS